MRMEPQIFKFLSLLFLVNPSSSLYSIVVGSFVKFTMNNETHPKRRALKQRFDRLLPKYGFLWKSMIQAEQKKASKPSFDFVSAIENKERTVFVAADCQCPFQDCQGCEEPILQEYQQSPTNSSATSDDNINDESKPSSTPDHRIRGDPNNSADAAALDTLSLGDDSVDFDFSKLNLSNDRSAAGFEDDEDSGNTEEDKQHDAKSKIADTFVDETIYDQANNESPEKYSTPTGSASDFQSDVRTPRKTTGNYSVDSDSDDSSTDTIVGPSKQPDNSFDALEDTPPKSKHFSRPDAFATPPSESKKDPENEEEIGEDDDAKSWLVPDDDCDDMYSSGSEEFSMGDEVIEIDSDLEEDWSDNNQATSSVDQGVIDLVESDEEEAPRKSTFSRGSSFKEKIPRKTKGEEKSNHFAKNRQKIVDAAFAEFNEIVFQGQLSQVEVTWSKKLRTTAGITRLCCTKEKGRVIKRSASIELSMKVLDDETRLRSTLLHECCHAAQCKFPSYVLRNASALFDLGAYIFKI